MGENFDARRPRANMQRATCNLQRVAATVQHPAAYRWSQRAKMLAIRTQIIAKGDEMAIRVLTRKVQIIATMALPSFGIGPKTR